MNDSLISAIQVSIRVAAAATLAVALALLLRFEFPIYALISAVVVTDLSAARTRQLALPRLAGTILGGSLGAAISTALFSMSSAPLIIGLSIFAVVFLSHFVGLKDGAKVAGYVCGVVLISHSDRPWSYALYRSLETLLGIGTAVLVSLVPKLLTNREFSKQDSF